MSIAPLTWLSWQLADSAFPSGGFAHSLGIESAQQQGFIIDTQSLCESAQAILLQQSQTSIPLLATTHQTPETLVERDALCHAMLTNHTAQKASIAQGCALARAGIDAFPSTPLEPMDHWIRTNQARGHFAPVFGYTTQALGFDLETAAHLYLFQTLRSLMSAAVRLSIVGSLQAQALTQQLSGYARDCTAQGLSISIQDIADPLPLLNVLQGNQDRLYSRLFQS